MQWLAFFLFLLLAVASGQVPDTEEVVMPLTKKSDKRALLAVRDAFGLKDVLTSWNETSDPCRDAWPHITCTCDVFGETFKTQAEHCEGYVPGDPSRIVYLELKSSANDENVITGLLPEALGELTELRWLNLEQNNLTGPVPDSFGNLEHLRYLSLAENSISGPLPTLFSNYSEVKTLNLHSNNFTGRVPEEWCLRGLRLFSGAPSNETSFTIRDNPLLCGEIPKCVLQHLNSVENTWLFSNRTEAFRRPDHSGACDSTPPVCNVTENGCYLQVPRIWTSPEMITFNFTSFTDDESDIAFYTFALRRESNSTSNDVFDLEEQSIVSADEVTLTLPNNETVNTTFRMVSFDSTLLDKGFIDGQNYTVRLTATNRAGPPLNTSIQSGPVRVDFSPPVIGEVFNTVAKRLVASLNSDDAIGASWTSIYDEHSNISQILVALVIQVSPNEDETDRQFETVKEMNVPLDADNVTFPDVHVKEGRVYRFNAIATNGVGLVASRTSAAFLVNETPTPEVIAGLPLKTLLPILVAVFVVLLACLSYAFLVWRRYRIEEPFDVHAYIKDYVYELMGMKDDDMPSTQFVLTERKEFAIVVTDIENSTAQSKRSDHWFKALLEIHNRILRNALLRYGGCEVSTEGDAFIIAFSSVSRAVAFAIATQEEYPLPISTGFEIVPYRLLYEPWPKEILRLPGCQVSRNMSGELQFSGVRVRMGIHWSSARGVTFNHQAETGSLLMKGPALDVARTVSDAGNGGQILLTQQAWMQLYPAVSLCKFPTVYHLGLYRSRSSETTFERTFILSITEWLGKGIVRHFPHLRKLEQVSKGYGFTAVPPPIIEPDGTLTFVSTRIVLGEEERLIVNLADFVYDILAAQAQLFQGHVISAERARIRLLLVFAKPLDAVRFTQVAQLKLVLSKWPSEMTKLYGDRISSGTHVPLFNGPRIAMAIHTTDDFNRNGVSGALSNGNGSHGLSGQGISFVHDLVDVCDGGQVVLSEKTWQRTQHLIQGRQKTINLGRHVISHSHNQPMLLIEMTPHMLAERQFRPVRTIQQTGPGFYDAPAIDEPMTVVFVMVHKPKKVIATDRAHRSDPSSDAVDDLPKILTVYNRSLDIYTDLLRQSLSVFDGYESKQLSPGRFFLAFKSFKDAILWACYLQSEMLDAEWPEELLELEDCSVQYCPITHRVLRRGLGLMVGMAYGTIAYRSPTKTGQADYFGAVSNLAARVLSITAPGQILIQPGNGFQKCPIRWIQPDRMSTEEVGVLSFPKLRNGVPMKELAVEIVNVGKFLAKGITELTIVYQAQVASLAVRGISRFDDGTAEFPGQNRRRYFANLYIPKVFGLVKEVLWQLQYSFTEWSATRNRLQMFPPSYLHSMSHCQGVTHTSDEAGDGTSYSPSHDTELAIQASEIHQPRSMGGAPSGSGLGLV